MLLQRALEITSRFGDAVDVTSEAKNNCTNDKDFKNKWQKCEKPLKQF